MVFDWYCIAYNGDRDLTDETDMEDMTFYASVSEGSVYGGGGPGVLDLSRFYRLGDTEYGVGTLELDNGTAAYIGMMRP